MSYEDFTEHSNHVLLEMVGSTPSPAGTWDERIPSQLLHLGIARGYGEMVAQRRRMRQLGSGQDVWSTRDGARWDCATTKVA